MPDVLIHHFDHIAFFDGTLPIFKNLLKNNFVSELDLSLLRSICFLKVFVFFSKLD